MDKFKINECFIFLILINIILILLRIKTGDPSTAQGNILGALIFIIILGSLLYSFLLKKYDYFFLIWLSFYFAAPIIKLPFIEIGILGILNGIFIPLMLIKGFDHKNKYFLIILSLILFILFNLSEVSLRLILSKAFNFIAPLLFFYFVTKKCKNPRMILYGSILVTLINIPLGIYEIIAKPAWGVLIDWRGVRIFGNLFWPNDYSIYLLSSIVILYMFLREKYTNAGFIFFVILLFANLLTFSRAGLLTMAIAIILFEVLYKGGFRITVKKIMILLMLILIFLVYNTVDIQDNHLKAETISERTDIWDTIIPKIKSHLILGNGLGSYELYQDQVLYELPTHNYYLNILFELGIVGLFIILLFMMMMIKDFTWKLRQKTNLRAGEAGLALTAAILVYSLTGNGAFTQVASLNLWIVIGCCMVYCKKHEGLPKKRGNESE